VPFLETIPFVGLAFLSFARGTSLDLFSPTIAFFLTGGATLTFRLLTEGRRNKWLKGTFSKYLAPSILEAIQKDPTLLDLGGREREISVLFSDVAGFTKISEGLSPPDLVRLLNKHLGNHAGAVMAEGGVVDKFIGDAVMAFWGDPLDMPDHAIHACRSALLALNQMPLLKPLLEELRISKFYMRLGINTGPAKVGNMGSEERVSYTCMGDVVNLASRLEGANKAFGSRILIGPLTYLQAKEAIVARPIADVRVVGKDQPVRVYELLAMRDGASAEVLARAEAFRGAQAAAKEGDLAGARAALDEAERLNPGDAVVAWFREILGRLESGAEPTPWSGVYVLESKG
jgi:adenylate cyclase